MILVCTNADTPLSRTFTYASRDAWPFYSRDAWPFHSRCPMLARQTVFEKFADFRFKRIVVVDEEARCKGIISVSDLLAYFL